MRRALLTTVALAVVCCTAQLAGPTPGLGGSPLIAGGGRIWEGDDPGVASADIAFSGFTSRVGPGTGPDAFRCSWRVQFKDVSVDWLDGRTARTTGCGEVAWTVPDGTDGRVRLSYMPAVVDGVGGYLLSMIAVDVGEPGGVDQVRIVLRLGPDTDVYDSRWDLTPVDAARTALDAGNVQVWVEP